MTFGVPAMASGPCRAFVAAVQYPAAAPVATYASKAGGVVEADRRRELRLVR
jgi:hypothetical protein